MNSKIINIKNLTKKIKNLKKKNFKIGLCHGVFDLLHYGHINHFNKAKNNCDFVLNSKAGEGALLDACIFIMKEYYFEKYSKIFSLL